MATSDKRQEKSSQKLYLRATNSLSDYKMQNGKKLREYYDAH